MLLPYGDNMSYTERVFNVIVSAYDWYYRNWIMLPQQNAIAQRYFGHLASKFYCFLIIFFSKSMTNYANFLEPGKPLPLIEDLYQNISLILVNAHRSTSKPRPLMPNIIYYGGAHIKPPKPLPSDLQQYLDTAEHGVIVFSLGSYLQA